MHGPKEKGLDGRRGLSIPLKLPPYAPRDFPGLRSPSTSTWARGPFIGPHRRPARSRASSHFSHKSFLPFRPTVNSCRTTPRALGYSKRLKKWAPSCKFRVWPNQVSWKLVFAGNSPHPISPEHFLLDTLSYILCAIFRFRFHEKVARRG
jgi:hypothetical protein